MIAIDFEYKFYDNLLKVVSVATYDGKVPKTFWLLDGRDLEDFYLYFSQNKNKIWLMYSAGAEATALWSLGDRFRELLDIVKVIDLRAELKLIHNNNNVNNDGLFSGGGLAAFTDYYGIYTYTTKTDTRYLILDIRKYIYTDREEKAILDYNLLDSINTFKLSKITLNLHFKIFGSIDKSLLLHRGAFTFKMGIVQSMGIPVNIEKVRDLQHKYTKVLWGFVEKSQYLPRLCSLTAKGVSINHKALNSIVSELGLYDKWLKTESDLLKTDKAYLSTIQYIHPFIQELKDFISFRHSLGMQKPSLVLDDIIYSPQVKKEIVENTPYPLLIHTSKGKISYSKINIVGYILNNPEMSEKYTKVADGHYLSKTSKKTRRIYPYMNPFGSRTGRNQPPAKNFIFAQHNSLRCLIEVPKGYKLVTIDIKAQEVILSALLSNDKNLLKDVLTGDPYLALAKNLHLCPSDATKQSHGKVRDKCKQVFLSTNYGSSSYSIAETLNISELEAKSLQTAMKKRYFKYWDMVNEYARVRLFFFRVADCGSIYTLKKTSALNFCSQSIAGTQLRYIINDLVTFENYKKGIEVIGTLHDCIMFLIKDDTNYNNNLNYIIKKYKHSLTQMFNYDKVGDILEVDIDVFNYGQIPLEKKLNVFENICDSLGWDYIKTGGNSYYWSN